MGFYIRKSVRVGPLRFNLSKSGIGVSTGVPGLRLGTGPRGNYVHMGRGGLYYRKSVSSLRRFVPPLEDLSVNRSHTHGPMSDIASGCVTEMFDSNSAALLSEMELKRKKIVWWPFMAVISFIISALISALLVVGQVTLGLALPCIVLLLIATIVLYQFDKLRKCVVLMYDPEGPSLESYQNLFAAINEIATCGAVWHITAKGNVYDPKYHAGAGSIINRRRFLVSYRDPPYVKTNLSIPILPFGNYSMYLLPDRILVYAPNGVGAVEYSTLCLSAHPTRFIEEDRLPYDANIVDYTWRFVNKSGDPDRRFNRNYQIPICQYEQLQITSSTGVSEILQFLRMGISNRLQHAIASVVDAIGDAEASERLSNSLPPQERLPSRKLSPTSDPKQTTTESASDATPAMLYAALFDVLCCIMVADGRVSTSEKLAIREIMSKLKAGWSDDEFEKRISSFIADIQKQSYAKVLHRSMSKLSIFRAAGRADVVAKCLDLVANADGKVSHRERDLCYRIRKSIGIDTSNDI